MSTFITEPMEGIPGVDTLLKSASTEIIIDTEFKDVLPPLTQEEEEKLEALLLEDGCTDPLTVWKGLLVDGHNRYEICTRHSLPFQRIFLDEERYPDRDSVMLWMLEHQKGRRNMTDIDWIATAMKHEEILARKAKVNLSAAGGDRKSEEAKSPLMISPKAITPVNTRAEAAKYAGVGEQKYAEGKLILEAAESGEVAPEVLDKVRSKEISIHKVATQIKQRRATKAGTPPVKTPRNIYKPNLGMDIVAVVTTHLESISLTDKSFEPALRDIIKYCEERLGHGREGKGDAAAKLWGDTKVELDKITKPQHGRHEILRSILHYCEGRLDELQEGDQLQFLRLWRSWEAVHSYDQDVFLKKVNAAKEKRSKAKKTAIDVG